MQLRSHDLGSIILEEDGAVRARVYGHGPQNIVVRISSWDSGLSLRWCTSDSPKWHSDITAPSFQLVPPPGMNAMAGLLPFLATIPRDVAELVAPFSWRQIEVMQLLRRAPQTRDLVMTNPLLVAVVLDHCARARPQRMPEDVLAQRQRDVLGELYGANCGTAARVRLLLKIRSHDYSRELCRSVRTVLRGSELPRVLAHVREILGHCIEALGDAANPLDADLPAIRRLLLSGAATGSSLTEMLSVSRDARGLGRFIHPNEPERSAKAVQARLESCADIQGIVRLHHQLLADANRNNWPPPVTDANGIAWYGRRDENTGGLASSPPPPPSFPAPPVRGTKDIIPIRSQSELLEEAAAMRHCCTIYAERIVRGESYLYRVLEPERATIELKRFIDADGGAGWRIAQLKLTSNVQASPATWELARAWLAGDLETSSSPTPATQ